MTAYSEEVIPISFSQGMYTADLASAIPDGYCAQCVNAVPTGTSTESRFGIRSSDVAFNESYEVEQFPTGMTHFGYTGDEDAPIIMWGSGQGSGSPKINMIREGDPLTDPGGTGSLLDATIPSDFYSAVNYNGNYYLFLAGGVYKLTNLNWSAGTFTTTLVSGSPVGDVQSVHFFDRLFTAKDSKVFWTDAITVPGGVPEIWDTTNNFTVIVGKNGPAKIYKLIPLGSRIYIFTSQGLFALTLNGSPSDWYVRPLDDNAIVNSYECAFQVSGLIYFISIYGVFVTNGSDSIKLSGPIENFFLAGNFEQGEVNTSKRSNVYRICYMDGGLIASVSNYFIDSGTAYYDVDYCHVFYTRLANVAWSKWKYDTSSVFGTQMVAVQGIADSVESYINKSPLNYLMVIQTDSRDDGTSRHSVRELMVYDGLEDSWTNPVGAAGDSSSSIKVELHTKYLDSGSPNNYKRLKYAFLEMYLSDKTRFNNSDYWNYFWNTDQELINNESIIQNVNGSDRYLTEFQAVKLSTDFNYRIVQFRLDFDTQNTDNLKVKNLYLAEHSGRDGLDTIQ